MNRDLKAFISVAVKPLPPAPLTQPNMSLIASLSTLLASYENISVTCKEIWTFVETEFLGYDQ